MISRKTKYKAASKYRTLMKSQALRRKIRRSLSWETSPMTSLSHEKIMAKTPRWLLRTLNN